MTEQSGALNMTHDQIVIFASGLHHLASVDGIDQSELDVIKEFLAQAGAPEVFEGLNSDGFDLHEAYDLLETSFLRRVFIKAAIVLVRADGELSDKERDALAEIADAFGQVGAMSEIEIAVNGVTGFS